MANCTAEISLDNHVKVRRTVGEDLYSTDAYVCIRIHTESPGDDTFECNLDHSKSHNVVQNSSATADVVVNVNPSVKPSNTDVNIDIYNNLQNGANGCSDHLSANRDLDLQQINKLWARSNFIPGEGGRDEPLYGELNYGSMCKIMDFLIRYCNFGKNSIYMDIGSGLGKTVFLAALYPGVEKSIGVEISEYRYSSSLDLKHLLETKWNYNLHNVCLMHGDITRFKKFDATHVYAFFPRSSSFPEKHVAKVFMKSRSCKYIVNYVNLKKMQEFGYSVRQIGMLKVCEQGKGASKFTVYIYEKQ